MNYFVILSLIITLVSCSSPKPRESVVIEEKNNQSSISHTKANLKQDYKTSLASIKRLDEIQNKKTVDYEIALSEAIVDVKNATKEALVNGNTFMALFMVNEGVKIAPFRGDLVETKSNVLDEYIRITNEYSQSTNINCNAFAKRISLLKDVAPDLVLKLKNSEKKCPEAFQVASLDQEINIDDLINDLPQMSHEDKSRYLNFVSYTFPEKHLLLESISRLNGLRFETQFVKTEIYNHHDYEYVGSKLTKVSLKTTYASLTGDVATKRWFGQDSPNHNFCERVSKILSYDGENKRKFSCGSVDFYTTPLAVHELQKNSDTFSHENLLPKHLIFKTTFALKDGKTFEVYSDGKIFSYFDTYKMKCFLSDINKNYPANEPMEFASSSRYCFPERDFNLTYYLEHFTKPTEANGVLSFKAAEDKVGYNKFHGRLDSIKNVNIQETVGFIVEFDAEKTMSFYDIQGKRDVVKYVRDLNSKQRSKMSVRK